MSVEKLIEASQRIMFLHMCEQEGITCGMPSPQDWGLAVDCLGQALLPFSEASINKVKEQKQDTNLNKSYTEDDGKLSEFLKFVENIKDRTDYTNFSYALQKKMKDWLMWAKNELTAR